MVFIDTLNDAVYLWSCVACGAIQAAIGAYTALKIWRSKQQDNKWFGQVISLGIAGAGAALAGAQLC